MLAARSLGMTKIQVTEDGSHTLFSEMAGQTYHSAHGAVQESRHIFISQLSIVNSQQLTVNSQRTTDTGQQLMVNGQLSMVGGDLSVLEIGFGTGLNALLAACWAKENGVRVDFSTIELYPLERDVYEELNYGSLLGEEGLFLKLHEAKWDAGLQKITPEFAICKHKKDIVEWLRNAQCTMHNAQSLILSSGAQGDLELDFVAKGSKTFGYQFDVVFFDAFSPDAQPELWTEEVFRNVYGLMKEGGVMTTYCAKGDVRRAMLAAGFKVEKLQGPPGKRHILRAVK